MTISKHSLVAYFDILGYQSFLKTNSALEMAEKVFSLVKSAPKAAVETWNIKDGSEDWKTVMASIRFLVFSDTIVISCPIGENGPTHELQTALIGGISSHLSRKMFEDGLPVRGAIAFGSFIFDETCIAGRAVVEAHDLCQKLDVAATAFSPKVSEFIDKTYDTNLSDVWDKHHPYYLFPLKDQSELKTRAVLWNLKGEKGDLTSKVRESFWKWNKDIPLDVDTKVYNTAKVFDFFRMHYQKQA